MGSSREPNEPSLGVAKPLGVRRDERSVMEMRRLGKASHGYSNKALASVHSVSVSIAAGIAFAKAAACPAHACMR